MNRQKEIHIKEKGTIRPSFSAGCYGVAYLLFLIVLVLATMMISQIYFISTDGLWLKFVLFLLFVSPYFAFPWWIERQRQYIGEIDLHILQQTEEKITFALFFCPHRAIQLTHIDAQLTIYQYHSPPPKKHSTYSIPNISYLAREENTIEEALTLSAQQKHPTLHISLPIPPDMPTTCEQHDKQSGEKSGISWNITITMGIKGWISWQQNFLLAVK